MLLKEKYINPLTDFGFKKLFGTEANKDLLINFLNQLLPQKHQIKDLTYFKNEQSGKNSTERKAIFDIFCKSKNGEQFIVELQRAKQEFFKDRSIFYSTHPIQAQALKGKWNFKLAPVYTIAILDFTFDDYSNDIDFLHRVQLKDDNGDVFYHKLSYIYIELPKFTKKLEDLETPFDKWLFAFRWMSKLKERPQPLQERVFRKLFKIAEIAKFNKMERLQYEDSLKQLRDYDNTMEYAKKQAAEEARKQGELNEKISTIKMGLEQGLSLNVISKLTRLSLEELEEIIKEQKWEI